MKALTAAPALVALLTLAACDQTPATEAEPDAAAPAEAASAQASAADAASDAVEARVREGLWQTVMTAEGNTITGRACMSAATSPVPTSGQVSAEDCEQTMARSGDGWTFSSRCALPTGGEIRSEGTMTGDLETAYRVEATTTTSGAPIAALNRTSQVTTEATYQGACPDGWRPGDVEVAGMRMNAGDMIRQAQEAAGR